MVLLGMCYVLSKCFEDVLATRVGAQSIRGLSGRTMIGPHGKTFRHERAPKETLEQEHGRHVTRQEKQPYHGKQ